MNNQTKKSSVSQTFRIVMASLVLVASIVSPLIATQKAQAIVTPIIGSVTVGGGGGDPAPDPAQGRALISFMCQCSF